MAAKQQLRLVIIITFFGSSLVLVVMNTNTHTNSCAM
jgi:hypothetical protein